MWNPFKSKTSNSSVLTTQVKKTEWRNNMWVSSPDGVGILFNMKDPTSCIVHLVGNDGITIKEVKHNIQHLAQAKWIEIPETRRNIDKERGLYLGYE